MFYLISFLCNSIKNKKYFLVITVFYIGWLLYLLIMLILYMFKFTEIEALRLASWLRYMNIYANSALTLMNLIIIYSCARTKNKIFAVCYMILIFFIGYPRFNYAINNNELLIKESQKTRLQYRDAENLVKENLKGEKHKIQFIIQNTIGYDLYLLKYSLKEYLSEIPGYFYIWSIGKQYSPEDVWTNPYYDEDHWKEMLMQNFDYVLLVKVDEQFIEQYDNLFENKNINNNQLYKVDVKKEKLILVDEA